jgi:hypothetical protein
VIAVFVCDEDAIELLHVFTDEREATNDLFRTQSGINKHACIAGYDQHSVPSRSTAQDSNFHRPQKGTKHTRVEEKSTISKLLRLLCLFVA